MALETERLLLRPWRDSDADALYDIARDPRVGVAAGWPPHTSVAESAEVIRTVFNRPGVYALQLKQGGGLAGCIGIIRGTDSNLRLEEREGEVAFWVGVPYWGRGLVPEALREVMRHAFEDIGLDALWCTCFADNSQSLAVQRKCGFRHHHVEERFNEFLRQQRTELVSRICREAWQVLPG